MNIYQVIKEPHIAEKANLQQESSNQISFKVHVRANKIEIRQAVETLFKTKVNKEQSFATSGTGILACHVGQDARPTNKI